jgi:hypothetical protein
MEPECATLARQIAIALVCMSLNSHLFLSIFFAERTCPANHFPEDNPKLHRSYDI